MKNFIKLGLLIFLVIGSVFVSGDWVRPLSNSSNNNIVSSSNNCEINIASSIKHVVLWNISASDDEFMEINCDFNEKVVFGGEVI